MFHLTIIEMGDDLMLDVEQSQLIKDNLLISLSFIELKALYILTSSSGEIISFSDLTDFIWKTRDRFYREKLYAIIFQLRKKVEDNPINPHCLLTIKKKRLCFLSEG